MNILLTCTGSMSILTVKTHKISPKNGDDDLRHLTFSLTSTHSPWANTRAIIPC